MESGFEEEHEHEEEEEETPAEALPKKSGKRAQKEIVTVPIIDGDGLGRKGVVCPPPPDNWSWRKYGQKPIKGSPYPRGHYKCSSSKGCPVRKQVERSRHDPSILVITYSGNDHNHPCPHPAATYKNKCPNAPTDVNDATIVGTSHMQSPEEFARFVELAGELGWLYSGNVVDGELGTSLVGAVADCLEAFNCMSMPNIGGEEDQHLFGDLGDLPESTLVFRWCEDPLNHR